MSTDHPPSTQMEQKLAGYWRELLGIQTVKPKDHFIELGGNSLLATLLANRIEEELGIRPTLEELFSTLEQMAVSCEEMLRAQGGSIPAP